VSLAIQVTAEPLVTLAILAIRVFRVILVIVEPLVSLVILATLVTAEHLV
jgi:hypothetical protein